MRMGGEYLKDSPIIIEALLSRLREKGGMSDEEHAVFCSPEAEKWAKWADTQLAVLLFPNITRNFSESYQVNQARKKRKSRAKRIPGAFSTVIRRTLDRSAASELVPLRLTGGMRLVRRNRMPTVEKRLDDWRSNLSRCVATHLQIPAAAAAAAASLYLEPTGNGNVSLPNARCSQYSHG